MLNQKSISNKLVIYYLSLTVITLILVSSVFYYEFKDALIKRTLHQLESINVIKKLQLEDYLQNTNNIKVLLHNPIFSEALSLSKSHKEPLFIKRDSIFDEKVFQLLNEQHYSGIMILNNNDSIIYYAGHENSLLNGLTNRNTEFSDIKQFINRSKNGISFLEFNR